MHLEKFSNNDSCLAILVKIKFPNGIFCKSCDGITRFYKVKNRPLYECSCGYQVSPLKDTIFENSHVPLSSWFLAIFNITSTRCGFSAAQLQRQLRVNYKTAWRMLHVIRKAMASDSSYLLQGIVEVDETYVGWRRNTWYGADQPESAIVFGMVERGGKAKLRHVADTSRVTLYEQIFQNISKDAHIMSDQHQSYRGLSKHGYKHDTVMHRKEYVRGNIYTQTIESNWGTLKRSISGTYRKTSKKWLQNYLNEFEWRYNHRKEPEKMFDLFLERAAKRYLQLQSHTV